MQADDIRHLYDHSFWATHKILDSTQRLTPEQYDGHPWDTASIHEIMTHTLAASTIWLARWLGDSPTSRVQTDEVPTPGDLAARFQAHEADLRAYLATLTDDDLGATFTFRTSIDGVTSTLPLWTLLLQIYGHNIQHRSEVATILTHYGQSPGNLDLLIYERERQ
ncbi:MAG: DinB family protein [Anaerolineae bacterium]